MHLHFFKHQFFWLALQYTLQRDIRVLTKLGTMSKPKILVVKSRTGDELKLDMLNDI